MIAVRYKYQELALASHAGTTVNSDRDLPVLRPWRGTRILRPAAYVAEAAMASDLVASTLLPHALLVSPAPPALVAPALVAGLGDAAAWRYVEFFIANIRNPNTRGACERFFGWCEQHGLPLAGIRPFKVAVYVEDLQREVTAPGVKQQLAAIRMLCDWLVTGQVMPSNLASSVRGPKHVVKTCKTPVPEGAKWRRRMEAIPRIACGTCATGR